MQSVFLVDSKTATDAMSCKLRILTNKVWLVALASLLSVPRFYSSFLGGVYMPFLPWYLGFPAKISYCKGEMTNINCGEIGQYIITVAGQ